MKIHDYLRDAVIAPMPGGIENTNLLLTFNDGRTEVMRVYRTKSIEEANHEINLLTSLESLSFCPSPIVRFESPIFLYNKRPAALFNYIPGTHPKPTDLVLFVPSLVQHLVKLHQVTNGGAYRCYWDLFETLSATGAFIDRFDEAGMREILDFLITESEYSVLTLSKANEQANHVIIHGDIDYANLLMSEDSLFLLDFDDSTKGPPELELGIAIRNLFLKRFDFPQVEEIKKLIDAYRKSSSLELPLLGSWTRFACFRYFVLMLERSGRLLRYPPEKEKNYLIYKTSVDLEKSLNRM